MTSKFHDPVLANEAVALLVTNPAGTYIDATVGGGGHSRIILEQLTSSGRLIGLDRDAEALAEARRNLGERIQLLHTAFSDIASVIHDPVDGVLMDLGVSSHQLDAAQRGFSYRFDGPLDLRMDTAKGITATELLKTMSLDELTGIIRTFGEDSQARRIAKAILKEQSITPITTTARLADVIRKSVPATQHKSLPRVFQALRIAVNNEMAELEAGLTGAWNILKSGGRLVVISYHSLEDRRAKQFFISKTSPNAPHGPAALMPDAPTGKRITRKPIAPSDREQELNPRSRSAELRVIEKL